MKLIKSKYTIFMTTVWDFARMAITDHITVVSDDLVIQS